MPTSKRITTDQQEELKASIVTAGLPLDSISITVEQASLLFQFKLYDFHFRLVRVDHDAYDLTFNTIDDTSDRTRRYNWARTLGKLRWWSANIAQDQRAHLQPRLDAPQLPSEPVPLSRQVNVDVRFLPLLRIATRLLVSAELDQPLDTLRVLFKEMMLEIREVKAFVPAELYDNSQLSRHVHFIEHYLGRNQISSCMSDMLDIVERDITSLSAEYRQHVSTTVPEKVFDWSHINPQIIRVAQGLFEGAHFSEAVEAATKEVNVVVKQDYYNATAKEDDGRSLMSKALGIDSKTGRPLVPLNAYRTVTDRNIQEGYMYLCMGIMQAARNPRAHENSTTESHEAWELIVTCSHLVSVLQTARIFRESGGANTEPEILETEEPAVPGPQ